MTKGDWKSLMFAAAGVAAGAAFADELGEMRTAKRTAASLDDAAQTDAVLLDELTRSTRQVVSVAAIVAVAAYLFSRGA